MKIPDLQSLKKINENVLEFRGRKYEFIEEEKEENRCKNCVLKKGFTHCFLPHPRVCTSRNRQDKKTGYFKLIEEPKELEMIEGEFYCVYSKSNPEHSRIFQYKKGKYKTSCTYGYGFASNRIFFDFAIPSDENILNLREATQEEIVFFFDKMIKQKNLVWKEIDRCWVDFDIKAQGSGVKIDSTNYVAKQDKGKPRYDLIPPEPLLELAKIMMNGAEKYSENSWKEVEPKRYYSALMRHLEADRMGEITDKESGFLHVSHALANIMFLNWFRIKEQIEREINELK